MTLGGRAGQEHRNIISTYAVVSVFRATYIKFLRVMNPSNACVVRVKKEEVCVATPELSDPESLSYGA